MPRMQWTQINCLGSKWGPKCTVIEFILQKISQDTSQVIMFDVKKHKPWI